MGTRGLTVVFYKNEYRVAQYGQWDHYPSGVGLDVLKFARDKMNPAIFKKKLLALHEVTSDELKHLWKTVGADDSGLVSLDISEKFKHKYPQLHRDCGADILDLVQNSEPGLMINKNLDFAADSLFCEWAYVIDLDKNTLEVYSGFNKYPITSTDRFYFLINHVQTGYFPVSLIKSWKLNDLPHDGNFVRDLSNVDGENNAY